MRPKNVLFMKCNLNCILSNQSLTALTALSAQKYEHSEFRYEIDSRALPNDEKLLRVQVVDSPYR